MKEKKAAAAAPSPESQEIGNERRFRLLVEGLRDYAIYMLDPAGNVTNWTQGAQRIQGYSEEEVLGRHFSFAYTPEDRAAAVPKQALERALREGKFEADCWQLRKDGSRYLAAVVIEPIYDAGEHIGFAKIERDVTERENQALALRDSERQFRLLVNSVTDYAIFMLDPEGNVTNWNAGGQRIKGYTPDEIIGQHFSRFYTEIDRRNGRPARALSIAIEAGRYEEEGWRVRKDGTFFWASVIIDPIRDENGKLLGFAKITRDITERREAQLSMQQMQRQLAEAQKLDALGQLTGGVAHDFNNLLMIVMGHIPTIKKNSADDPRLSRAAQAIEIAAQRGASLTRQLLSFARRQRVNPEAVNLHDRIEAIREVLDSGTGSIELAIEIPLDAWWVKVDVSEFEIALVNLVVNARDAMPSGGKITITAHNVNRADDGNLAAGEYVSLSVADTGTGIPEDVLGSVFDPFFTTKGIGRGTGLGLSQVHGFAHQAGGSVEIASTLGHGTIVTLYLPRAPLSAKTQEAPAQTSSELSGSLLLVEDNPDVATATTVLLEQLGYSVQWAGSAEDALKAIEIAKFDVVLSDIVMPGPVDGLGLARAIRSTRPDLPILLATGYSDSVRAEKTDFPILRKPYQLHELSTALSTLTHGREASP